MYAIRSYYAQDAGVKNTSSLDGLKEKRSYAMGMIVGHQFRNRSVDVDLGLYVRRNNFV